MVKRWLLVCFAACLVCACATPQTRSEKYANSFEKLSQEDKQLVLSGKIREGLPSDGVLIALGEPAKINKGVREGKEEWYWVYTRLATYTLPGRRYAPISCRDGDIILSRVYRPEFITYSEDDFEVVMRNDRVIGWRDL